MRIWEAKHIYIRIPHESVRIGEVCGVPLSSIYDGGCRDGGPMNKNSRAATGSTVVVVGLGTSHCKTPRFKPHIHVHAPSVSLASRYCTEGVQRENKQACQNRK